ncbi:MAG: ABC transporter ATP-binding protein [Verrucomicrobiota bacterium]
MSDIAIQVDSLWKKYRLGVVGTGTLRHDLNRWWHRVRGKSDPYAAIEPADNANGTRAGGDVASGLQTDEIWALRDLSFEVKRGEVMGIIGRNGAGKSTLLKIFSRVTAPTRGEVRIKGRIASLLEVGTGFHPELTGRENIFLNGVILGMTKAEIRSKFDEIVDFAGVEKFIDTPVKRYSSGMCVRLAFAVAAHLDPEILLIDEVLAVGDHAFQQKCLGKMKQVSHDLGRTVLFVSHNMAALRALCTRSLLLTGGTKAFDGASAETIQRYLEGSSTGETIVTWNANEAPQADGFVMHCAYIRNGAGNIVNTVHHDEGFDICVEYELSKHLSGMRIGFMMQTNEGVVVCGSNDVNEAMDNVRQPNVYVSVCRFPPYVLNEGQYQIQLGAETPLGSMSILTPFCLSFQVQDLERHGHVKIKLPGIVRPRLAWKVETIPALTTGRREP